MFVDTHCHLNIMTKKDFDVPLRDEHFPQIKNIIDQAAAAGVTKIVNVGTSLQESINSVEIAKRFDPVVATVGLHPCDCTPDWRKDIEGLKKLLEHKQENKIVGIGEVGLDFFHKPFDAQRQKDAFKAQIELSLEHELALVIHVREAGDELLRVLEEYAKDIKRAVIHCFCQSQDFADQVIEWGFYLGIDAPITYPKNELLRSVVKNVPLENLVLETDAPFLPPQKLRGKGNSPAYIPMFTPLIADIKGVSVDDVARVTTANALKLFSLT